MIISIINHTQGKLKDDDIQIALRAVNRQIKEDFEPYWSIGATLRLEGRSTARKNSPPVDMRGDAIIYLRAAADSDGALGFHDSHYRGIPYGIVFTDISDELAESWTTTMSHEALELIGDPEVNLLVMGPHPTKKRHTVFHWYEMCDAVQAESYKIDEVEVSNFVLPLYFTGGEERGGRNDFLGNRHGGRTLRSFSANPGGYFGFFDPRTGKHHTHDADDDGLAAKRRRIKFRAKAARRGLRYQRFRK